MSEDRRCWRYREGEARIFDSPEAVPEGEGWVDSPALVGEAAPKRRGRPPRAVNAPLIVETEETEADGDGS